MYVISTTTYYIQHPGSNPTDQSKRTRGQRTAHSSPIQPTATTQYRNRCPWNDDIEYEKTAHVSNSLRERMISRRRYGNLSR